MKSDPEILSFRVFLLLEDGLVGEHMSVLEGIMSGRNIVGGQVSERQGQSLGAGSIHQVTAS